MALAQTSIVLVLAGADAAALADATDGADKGITPLTTSELFRRVEEQAAKDSNLSFSVEVSYIEIYNEK